jgi:hypothetical protein
LSVPNKRELLLAICETPGWQPPSDCASIERELSELAREGWILPRLDGWTASPRALDRYPTFTEQDDIADPSGDVCADADARPVPRERVVALIEALLYEMSVPRVQALVGGGARPARNETVFMLANEMVERMCR